MALITCPECGGTVSNTAETCPHCGFRLITDVADEIVNTTQNVRNAYDVMLIDYRGAKLVVKRELAEILDCTLSEAKEILEEAPVYLYNDITFSEATNIAEELKESNMRAAVYGPDGSVEYYTPVDYSLALPILTHIVRRPRRVAPPRPRRERYPNHKKGFGVLFDRKKPEPAPAHQAKPSQPKPNQSHGSKPQQHTSQPKPAANHAPSNNANHSSQPRPSQSSKPSSSRPQQSGSHSRPSQSHGSSSSNSRPGNSGGGARPGSGSHSMNSNGKPRNQGPHR